MWHSSTNAMNFLYLRSHEDKFYYLFKGQSRQIMDFFDVDKATAFRWIRNKKPTSKPALRLLDVAASGFLPPINGWNGFVIVQGRLITPNGFDLLPSEIVRFGEEFHLRETARIFQERARNFKPWRDREPDFVKRFNRMHQEGKNGYNDDYQ